MLQYSTAALLLAALAASAQPVAKPAPAKPKAPAGRTLRVVAQTADLLRATELQATLSNGKPARVLRVRSSQDDLLLLLVADLTGDLTRVDGARAALDAAIVRLPANVWIGLLRAQDGLHVVSDPGPDREKLKADLHSLPITGKSGLLDTVVGAVQLGDAIAAKTAARVAVLYISDSEIRNYREDFTNPVINSSDARDLSRRFPEGLVRERIARLKETLAGYQTPVFIAHLQYSSERLSEAYQSGLFELAASTGGIALFSRTLSDIADTIERALTAAHNHQQILVQLPPRTPRDVSVSLQAAGTSLPHRTRFLLP